MSLHQRLANIRLGESGANRLAVLPSELLTELLSYCSVEDVIRFGMTCKCLHQVTETRSVWLNLLYGLSVEYSPNVPPRHSISSLTLIELKNTVTDAVHSFKSWKSSNELHISHSASLSLESPQDGYLDRIVEARLLPGGEELLTVNCNRLEVWSLQAKTCMWRAPVRAECFYCFSFDFDIVEDGRIVMIVSEFSNQERTATSIAVFRYDREARSAEIISSVIFPYMHITLRLMLQGDFCVAFLPHLSRTMILEWKKRRSVFLDFVDSEGQIINNSVRSTILFSGNLLATVNSDSDGFFLFTLPLSFLDGSWSHSDTDYTTWNIFACRTDLRSASSLQLSAVGELDDGPWIVDSLIFTPTWKKEENVPTEMYIVAYSNVGVSDKLLLTYRVHLFPSSQIANPAVQSINFTSVLINTTRAPTSRIPWEEHCISNSGRMICLRNSLRCYSLFSDATQPRSELTPGALELEGVDEGVEWKASFEPWSGTVVASRHGMVKKFRLT